jgi:hypothetical protein
MSFERSTAGTGIGAEPAPTPSPGEIGGGTPLALQLQVLSTEHWSLLASRSLAWNESFSRAGMFLSTLSGAIVALALVAQASEFGDDFRIFALVILPVVLFIGLTTLVRLGIANYHDGLTVIGMNRIRAAYFERVPEVRRYFVMPGTDDAESTWRAMGMDIGFPTPVVLLASAPSIIGVLNAVIAGSIGAIAAIQLGADTAVALTVGAILFIALFAAQVLFGRREALRRRPEWTPMFPPEPDGDAGIPSA